MKNGAFLRGGPWKVSPFFYWQGFCSYKVRECHWVDGGKVEAFPVIIGRNHRMREVFSLIDRVACTDSTVLIFGESGTGKELVARAIHYRSPRRDKPLVAINCGALPEELLESELFGHVKGAFTGALRDKKGRFEAADGGTVFLDEVSEMSPALQVKLLRVLQEREFERVGDVRTIKVDIRIIAATNRDLEALVKEGKFREDLYWRLNVIPICLPPLRDRRDDIPLLLSYFLRVFNQKRGGRLEGFSPEAMELLMAYPWPGNVRELENLVERLVVLKGEGIVTPQDLPEKIRGERTSRTSFSLPEEGMDLSSAVNNLERQLILEALKKSGGVKSKAAKMLGIKRTTLIEKIKRNGLEQLLSKTADGGVPFA